MIYIFSFLNVALIVFLIVFEKKKLYDPLVIYLVFWSAIISLSTLNLFDFFEVKESTYLMFEGGLIAFFFGYILFNKVEVTQFKRFGNGTYSLNYALIYMLIFIVVVYLMTQIPNALQLFRSNNSIDTIRYMFFDYDVEDNASRYSSYFRTIIVTPIIYSLAVCVVLDIFGGKRDKKLWISAIIITILYIFMSGGGRLILLNYIFHFLFAFMIFRTVSKIPRKVRRRIVVVMAVGVVALLGVNAFRDKGNTISELLKQGYTYYVGSIRHFEIRIERLGTIRDNGVALLGGYLRPLFLVIGLIGISAPSSYNVFLYQNSLLQSGVKIGTNTWYNAYVTLNFHFYLSFGVIGILIGNFIYGIFCSVSMQNVEKHNNLFSIGFLMLVIQGLLTSMVRWQFSTPAYAMSFIFLRLSMKKEKTNASGC